MDDVFKIAVSAFVGYLASMSVAKFNRRNTQDDKDEAREEEISKEKIISDRMVAESARQQIDRQLERMSEKVDRQEVLIGQLRESLAAKDAENAVLNLRNEILKNELKKARGE